MGWRELLPCCCEKKGVNTPRELDGETCRQRNAQTPHGEILEVVKVRYGQRFILADMKNDPTFSHWKFEHEPINRVLQFNPILGATD